MDIIIKTISCVIAFNVLHITMNIVIYLRTIIFYLPWYSAGPVHTYIMFLQPTRSECIGTTIHSTSLMRIMKRRLMNFTTT